MSKANRNHHKTPKDTSRDAVAPAPSPARPPGDPSSAGSAAARVSAQGPAQRPTAAPPVRSMPAEAAPARAVRAVPATAPTRSGADAPAPAAPARAAPVAVVAPAPAAPAAPATAPSAPQSASAEVNGSAKDEKRAPAAKAPARAAKPTAKPKASAEDDQPAAADRQAPSTSAVRLANHDVMAGERRAAALPAEGELKDAAAVDFDAGSAPRLTGELQAGGPLVVRYASNRSPYQHESAEGPAWGVQAFVEFKPGGERHTAPAIAFREEAGRLAGAPQSVPLLISVPKSATSVALFFKQWTGADRPQEVWDSNWGQNYVFEVKRS